MTPALRNPLALLVFSALCAIAAVVLLLTNHQAPTWLTTLAQAGVLGGAAVMTPGLPTVEKLLGTIGAVSPIQTSNVSPVIVTPATVSEGGTDQLSPSDFEPDPTPPAGP